MSESQFIQIDTPGGPIIAASLADVAALYQKVADVIRDIPNLPKDQNHGQFMGIGYDNVAELVGALLIAKRLSFSAAMVDHGKQDGQATAELALTLVDLDTGAMVVSRWASEATDVMKEQEGNWGLTKAATNALKTWLLRTFLVSAEMARPVQPATQATTRKATVDRATGEIGKTTTTAPASTASGKAATQATTPADQQIRHPLPADNVDIGKKFTWMADGFKLLGWGPKHQVAWLQRNCQVQAVSDLKNGHLAEAIQLLYLEINPHLITSSQPAEAATGTAGPDS